VTTFDPYTLIDPLRTASIVDALGRTYQHKGFILDLVTPTPERKLFGPAATISFLPYREDLYEAEKHNFGYMFYKAVGDSPQGKVLVMACNGYPHISMGGSRKYSRLQNHGLAGLLCDGRSRDFDELAAYDFVTFCSGEATQWGGGTIVPFAADIPVSVGGVTVVPGDYVFADSSGTAIIPASGLQKVLEEAVRVEEEDDRAMEEIRREDPSTILKQGLHEH